MDAHSDKCFKVYQKLRPFLMLSGTADCGVAGIVWHPSDNGKGIRVRYKEDGSYEIARPTYTQFCEFYDIPPFGNQRPATGEQGEGR